jgi:hypothetical protein
MLMSWEEEFALLPLTVREKITEIAEKHTLLPSTMHKTIKQYHHNSPDLQTIENDEQRWLEACKKADEYYTNKQEANKYFQAINEMAGTITSKFYPTMTIMSSGRTYVYERKYGYYDNQNAIPKLKKTIVFLCNKQSGNSKFRANILDLIINSSYVDDESEFFKKFSNAVALNNGVLNLDNLSLDAPQTIEQAKETEATIQQPPTTFLEPPHKSKIVMYHIPVLYDKTISSEPINKYVESMVAPEHCLKLQEHCGNLLANHYLTKKLLFALGPQDGGKSTFFNVISYFLTDANCSALNLSELGEKFTNADIYGKRANICSDIPFKLHTDHYNRIKEFTGGDAVTLQFKGKDVFKYRSTAKLFFSANGVPVIDFSLADDAFLNRWDFVEFPYSFDKKSDVFKKYTTPEMQSALLNWIIEGYVRLKSNNWKFTNASTLDEIKSRLRMSIYQPKDDFELWLFEGYESDNKGFIPKPDLFRDCRRWHEDKGLHYSYMSDYKVFCKKMSQNNIIKVKTFRPLVKGKQEEMFLGIKEKGE